MQGVFPLCPPFCKSSPGGSAAVPFSRLRRGNELSPADPTGISGRFAIGNKNRSFAVGKTKRRGRAGGTFPKRSKHPEGAELQRRAGGTLGQLWGCRLCRPHGSRSGPRVTPAYPVRRFLPYFACKMAKIAEAYWDTRVCRRTRTAFLAFFVWTMWTLCPHGLETLAPQGVILRNADTAVALGDTRVRMSKKLRSRGQTRFRCAGKAPHGRL